MAQWGGRNLDPHSAVRSIRWWRSNIRHLDLNYDWSVLVFVLLFYSYVILVVHCFLSPSLTLSLPFILLLFTVLFLFAPLPYLPHPVPPFSFFLAPFSQSIKSLLLPFFTGHHTSLLLITSRYISDSHPSLPLLNDTSQHCLHPVFSSHASARSKTSNE